MEVKEVQVGENQEQVNVEGMETVLLMLPTVPNGDIADLKLDMPMEGMVHQLTLMLGNAMSKLTVLTGLHTVLNLDFAKKQGNLVQMDLQDKMSITCLIDDQMILLY